MPPPAPEIAWAILSDCWAVEEAILSCLTDAKNCESRKAHDHLNNGRKSKINGFPCECEGEKGNIRLARISTPSPTSAGDLLKAEAADGPRGVSRLPQVICHVPNLFLAMII
jgi:hypothetical protein